MRFEREQCLDLDAAFARTWLLADGRGAFAAGCVLGCPASRHHGLLIAPAGPDGAPHVFLERLEEWLVDGERALPISSARYPGVVEPSGHTYLASFDVWPTPTWRYLVGDVEVLRTLAMLEGPGHGVEVRWQVRAPRGRSLALRVRPFLACRPANALTQQNPSADLRVVRTPLGARLQPYVSLPALELEVRAGATLIERPAWHRAYEHVQDAWNGRPAREDHLALATIEVPLAARDDVTLRAWVGARPASSVAGGRGGGSRRAPGMRRILEVALARHVQTTSQRALRATPRLPEARSDLFELCEGLPTLALQPRGGTGLGDLSPDAAVLACTLTVWHALLRPMRAGEERVEGTPAPAWAVALAWARAAFRALERRGSRDPFADLLTPQLVAFAPMCRTLADAGPPAVAQALDGARAALQGVQAVASLASWVGLLARLARLRAIDGPLRAAFGRHAREAGRHLRARFWLEDEGHLADAWVDGVPDRSIRPGMLVAAAEPAVPLSKAERLAIVERARVELLTPRGLRTLSPRDPAYDPNPGPRAPQPPTRRNGAVEPRWLLPYAQATLLARGRAPAVKARLRALVEGFGPHLSEHGLGCVAEVFDGEPPHRASGAPSDVRSILALLEVLRLTGAGGRRGGRA